MAGQDRTVEVREMMEQYDKVYKSGDIAGLRRIRHPKFAFTSSRGARMSNEEELSMFADGSSRVDSLEVLESEVRVVGDTAVVLQQVNLSGIWNDAPFSGNFAMTITWTRTSDGWKVIADHSSAIES